MYSLFSVSYKCGMKFFPQWCFNVVRPYRNHGKIPTNLNDTVKKISTMFSKLQECIPENWNPPREFWDPNCDDSKASYPFTPGVKKELKDRKIKEWKKHIVV